MRAVWGWTMRLALAGVAGLLLSEGYALRPWWWAPFVAPVPLILALGCWRGQAVAVGPAGFGAVGAGDVAAGRAAGVGPAVAVAVGVVAGAASLVCVFGYYLAMAKWPGMAMIVPLRVLSWALIAGLTSFAARRLPLAGAMLVLPAAAAALELLTLVLSHDGAAGSLAYSQGDRVAVEQVAALGGVPAVVFVVLLPGSLAGLLLVRRWTRAQRRLALGLVAALGAGVAGFAAVRLAPAPEGGIPVSLVATDRFRGISRDWDAVWAAYAPTVGQVARDGGLVVLPEKIALLDPAQAGRAAASVSAVAVATGASVVVGVEVQDGSVYRNRALAAEPDGRVLWYDKQRLVTGWEARDVPGTKALLLEAGGTRLGVAICKDMHIPSIGRAYDGAGVMAVPAWDFGRDGWMGARMTALRAIENGYGIARSAREGLAGAYDADGRVIAEQTVGAGMTVVQAVLPVGRGATLYGRVGDGFGWLCVGGVAGLLVYAVWPRVRRVAATGFFRPVLRWRGPGGDRGGFSEACEAVTNADRPGI